MIKVLVNGAFGRMGSEVVRMVTANPELELAGGVDINAAGKTLPDGKPVFTNIGEALEAVKPDVVVDFVPNFALGAVVMIKLATEAAKYFKDVEIIEKHHDQKLDAPSGTAILTAQKIGEVREAHKQGHPNERETLAGSRGGDIDGIRIHSMRLQGYVASQEVVFGSQGETLKIINDTINRECYMPGVAMACKKIGSRQGLVYGLDQILD